jgi:hypothetical protein
MRPLFLFYRSLCLRVSVAKIGFPAARLEFLSDLLSAERANTIEAKREDHAVFVAQAHIESKVLGGNGAAFPGVTRRGGRADKRTVAGKWMLLKIEEERHAAKESFVVLAERDTWAPLRTAQRSRFPCARIGELLQAGHQFDGARVIKSGKRLEEIAGDAERRRHIA